MNTTHLIYILILLVAVVVIVHATKTSTTVASELDAFTAILVSIYLLPIAARTIAGMLHKLWLLITRRCCYRGDMESGLKTSRLRKPKAPLFIHQGRQLEGWLPPLNSASHTTVQAHRPTTNPMFRDLEPQQAAINSGSQAADLHSIPSAASLSQDLPPAESHPPPKPQDPPPSAPPQVWFRACEVTPRFAYEGTHSAYARNIAGVQEGRPWSSTSSQVWIFKKLLPNGVTTWITRHLHFPYTFTVCSTYLYRTCKLHEGTVMKVSDFYLSNFDKSYYLDFSCGESNMGIQASFSASIYTLVLLGTGGMLGCYLIKLGWPHTWGWQQRLCSIQLVVCSGAATAKLVYILSTGEAIQAFSSEDDTSAPRRVVDMLGMLNVSMYLCMWIQLALPLCFPDTLQDIVKAKVETAGKHLGMALREYGRFERLLLYTGIPAFVIILCMSTMLLAPEIFQDNHLVGAMGMLVSIVLLIALLFWARKLLDLDVYQTQRRAHVLTDMLCAKTFLCLPVYLSVCLNAPLLASVCIAYCMISFAVDFLPIDPVDLKLLAHVLVSTETGESLVGLMDVGFQLTVDMAVPLDTVRHALLASIHAYDEDASESGPADLAEQSDASAPSFGRADVSPSPAEDCAGAAALDEASAQTQERTLPAMQRDKSEPQLEAEALPPPVLQVPHRCTVKHVEQDSNLVSQLEPDGKISIIHNEESDTKFLVYNKNDLIMVSFRGTNSSKNIKTDINLIKVDYRVRPELKEALKLEQARFWDLMPLVILFWLVVAQYYSMAALASVRLATVLLVITTIHTLPRSLWQTLDCFLRRPKVHQGFWEAYLSIEGELTRALSTYAAATPNLRAIVFTGHSLGGALATIGSSPEASLCSIPFSTFAVRGLGDDGVKLRGGGLWCEVSGCAPPRGFRDTSGRGCGTSTNRTRLQLRNG
ncbi:hypothetical protein CYMTET_53299 [Cymbomonas tetramitiformis]|uniref:Fungal lipase-type domain-containing protein n=1 Tax=Cymbomonas tetramitiformis TaxID=36881 RepID=A0AAE0EQR1_9CHLO|nr:hypothetical protein CYMTET_53299 [Cymbomonas tetramitiformis]